MFQNRLQGLAVGIVCTAALVLGSALASTPKLDLGTASVASGSTTGYLSSRSVGGTTGICYRNDAPKPSFACFRRALATSGLTGLLEGNRPVTMLAPTDAAFAHLADTVGDGAVRAFLKSPSATAAFIRSSVVHGALGLSDLAARTTPTTTATQMRTVGGRVLTVRFGASGYGVRSTTVKIGPSDAVDGQSFVIHAPVRLRDGNVLIPLGRLTQPSLTS